MNDSNVSANHRKANDMTFIAVLSSLAGLNADLLVGPLERESRQGERPCLNCGRMKIHNNCFCSAECCREHREKSRNRP